MAELKKPKKVRGVVIIDTELCKGCGFCIEFCPTDVLEFSDEFNSKGYHPPRIARPDACAACDLCGMYCPDFAIFAISVKDAA
jgi:2-oxoglutarate ferredoxin oxidoreductase subunit delta